MEPAVTDNRSPVILGPDGRPWSSGGAGDVASVRSMYGSTFARALAEVAAPAAYRSRSPLKNHAWVYAAAMALAVNIGQVRFGVYVETEEQINKRRLARVRAGLKWTGASAGFDRRAIDRHLASSARRRGRVMRGVEPMPDHPASMSLARPNALMSQSQLIQITVLWLMLRGESVWLWISETGEPLSPGERPVEVYPLNPDQLRPEFAPDGSLLYWDLSSYRNQDGVRVSTRTRLRPDEVSHFRFVDPSNPVRGMSPLTAVAGGIEIDMLSQMHMRSTLRNGATPAGFLVDKSGMSRGMNPKDRQLNEDRFNDAVGGAQNSRKTIMLEGGIEWVPAGLTPQDMEFVESRRWNREEILAVLGVPKSVLSVTDDLNYSIQISQDFAFWDKRGVPIIRMIEDELDATLMFHEVDSVFFAADLTSISALRIGMKDQIDMADKLAGSALHVPPVVAFETVGLEMPRYDGDEVSLVSPVLAPASDVAEGSGLSFGVPAPDSGGSDSEGEDGGGEDGGSKSLLSLPAVSSIARAVSAAKYWEAAYKQVMRPFEPVVGGAYEKWVKAEKSVALDAFDRGAKELGLRYARPVVGRRAEADAEVLLQELAGMQVRLGDKIRPAFSFGLDLVYAFTAEFDMNGVPIFELDDPRIVSFFDRRQKSVLGKMPVTVQENTRRSLIEGLNAGEPLASLRRRVAETYDLARSHHKTLTVAVTESGGFISGARDVMFEAQGFRSEEWVTSSDEHVRESHVAYGSAGAKDRGFDYLTLRPASLPSVSGRLRYPHDLEGPADEVINCRCLKRPME